MKWCSVIFELSLSSWVYPGRPFAKNKLTTPWKKNETFHTKTIRSAKILWKKNLRRKKIQVTTPSLCDRLPNALRQNHDLRVTTKVMAQGPSWSQTIRWFFLQGTRMKKKEKKRLPHLRKLTYNHEWRCISPTKKNGDFPVSQLVSFLVGNPSSTKKLRKNHGFEGAWKWGHNRMLHFFVKDWDDWGVGDWSKKPGFPYNL